MDTPICRTCANPQRGVVEFRWSEGAVVYECKECGAFNEVSEIVRPVSARPSHRPPLRVTRTHESSPPAFVPVPRISSRDHVR
jgi:uncharacterized Zn finger protein